MVAGCHVMTSMIIDKYLIIACGIMVLLATASAAGDEKRSTEQRKHAQLISNDTTLTTTVSGARTRRVHTRTITLTRTCAMAIPWYMVYDLSTMIHGL